VCSARLFPRVGSFYFKIRDITTKGVSRKISRGVSEKKKYRKIAKDQKIALLSLFQRGVGGNEKKSKNSKK